MFLNPTLIFFGAVVFILILLALFVYHKEIGAKFTKISESKSGQVALKEFGDMETQAEMLWHYLSPKVSAMMIDLRAEIHAATAPEHAIPTLTAPVPPMHRDTGTPPEPHPPVASVAVTPPAAGVVHPSAVSDGASLDELVRLDKLITEAQISRSTLLSQLRAR